MPDHREKSCPFVERRNGTVLCEPISHILCVPKTSSTCVTSIDTDVFVEDGCLRAVQHDGRPWVARSCRHVGPDPHGAGSVPAAISLWSLSSLAGMPSRALTSA